MSDAPASPHRHRALRDRDPRRWRQARDAIRFTLMRNGIIYHPRPDEIAQLADPSRPQGWRTAVPARAQPGQPRVDPCWPQPAGPDPQRWRRDMHNSPAVWAWPGDPMPPLGDARRRLAKMEVNQVTRKLDEIGFQYAKTLGWGGHGLAAMYYYRTRDGAIKKAVAKIQFGGIGRGRDEREMVSKLRGKQHILQRLAAVDLAVPHDPDQVISALSDDRLTLFEFAKYGTLQNVLHRHGNPDAGPEGQRPFPNRALVEIFRCLAKACIDMQFPAPPANGQLAAPIIHLDFEPTNLLFTEHDRTEHPILPKLKLADFGLAADVPNAFGDMEAAANWVWDMRWRAKEHWFLPEQFSADWNFINVHPLLDGINTYGPVAGNFGPPSNVYHVGMVMWCCITGCRPQLPTNPEPGPFPLPDGRPWWTYGASALQGFAGSVDEDILYMVIRCLVEEPARRITAAEVVAWADRKVMTPMAGDEGLEEWKRANFKRAPEVSRADRQKFDPRVPGDDQVDPFA